ncbi:hypothetical protein H7K28_03320 [Paenibacillus polymyxa]|jgi:repressor of nif and glnA expression|uniref:hypothetical protein n=1 Tax=Paenibacillus TaxID=44249 RepID=UPI00142DF5FE|nr:MULTISPECIES: hypothetical protein [Paenibacillus]KAF6615205.1 hypothetical protein HFE00_21345 [Paenibacillus sp. EKM101P]KAF6618807.1 hypothetical protein HFE03_20735 [Paenibacillus sp. EKM102P]KAF6627172.1 hypothetical protein HFE01_20850 [Paenibacillus sp. EKM10P]KAF6643564.1 hypothetical protein HFE02_21490 [Paenibacillus sp. EKM11P]MBY0024230.1 hypothetical protein [Paenibacillus polymyxa]
MHADVQNLFIRIQMLSYAHQDDLTVRDIQPILEERGYRVGEREVKQELENLTQENFLTPHDDMFSLTGAGIEELQEIQSMLGVLYEDVVKNPAHVTARASS